MRNRLWKDGARARFRVRELRSEFRRQTVKNPFQRPAKARGGKRCAAFRLRDFFVSFANERNHTRGLENAP